MNFDDTPQEAAFRLRMRSISASSQYDNEPSPNAVALARR